MSIKANIINNMIFCLTDFLLHSFGEKEEGTEHGEPFNHDLMRLRLQKFGKYVFYPFATSSVNFQKHRFLTPHSLAHLAEPTWEDKWRDWGVGCLGNNALQKALSGSVCCWSQSLYKHSTSKFFSQKVVIPHSVFFSAIDGVGFKKQMWEGKR